MHIMDGTMLATCTITDWLTLHYQIPSMIAMDWLHCTRFRRRWWSLSDARLRLGQQNGMQVCRGPRLDLWEVRFVNISIPLRLHHHARELLRLSDSAPRAPARGVFVALRVYCYLLFVVVSCFRCFRFCYRRSSIVLLYINRLNSQSIALHILKHLDVR